MQQRHYAEAGNCHGNCLVFKYVNICTKILFQHEIFIAQFWQKVQPLGNWTIFSSPTLCTICSRSHDYLTLALQKFRAYDLKHKLGTTSVTYNLLWIPRPSISVGNFLHTLSEKLVSVCVLLIIFHRSWMHTACKKQDSMVSCCTRGTTSCTPFLST